MPGADAFRAQLQSAGLQHLAAPLARHGIEDADTLAAYSAEELRRLKIAVNFGERKKLLLVAGGAALHPPSPAAVDSFLRRSDVSLPQYAAACHREGVDTLQVLGACSEQELEQALGVALSGHRKKLLLRLGTSPQSSPTLGHGSPVGTPPSSPGDRSGQRPGRPVSIISGDGPRHTRMPSGGFGDLPLPEGRSDPSVRTPGDDEERSDGLYSTINSTNSATVRVGYTGRASRGSSPEPNWGASVQRGTGTIGPPAGMIGQTPPSKAAAQKAGRTLGRSISPNPSDGQSTMTGSIFQRDAVQAGRSVQKNKLVNVFENGHYCDAGGSRGLWTACALPRVQDMQVLLQVLTRQLGWHRRRDDIYRQTDSAAGGREVSQLWAFNGRPLRTPDEVEDGMWIVAGSGHQPFISPSGTETSWTKKDAAGPGSSPGSGLGTKEKGGAASGLSIFDRLSNPNNFTGSQAKVHASSTGAPTKGAPAASVGLSAKSGGVKGRQSDKMAAAKQRALESKKGGSPCSSPPGGGPLGGAPAQSVAPPGTIGGRTAVGRGTVRSPPATGAKGGSTSPRGPRAHAPAPAPAKAPAPAPAPAPAEATWDIRAAEAAMPTVHGGGTMAHFGDLEGLSPQELIQRLESRNKTVLHSWTKMELLGKGSFGMVYRGQLKDGATAAVKLVQVPKDDSAELALLVREVMFMTDFDHRRIVKCFGCLYDRDTNEVQIFLELMPGGSVAGLVAKQGRLKDSLAQKYTRQLLDGLAYLHARGVVHRDVKGDNLLLDAHGDAHIADFGTSKQMLDSLCSKTKGCATMVGTPYWMAPEVIMANPDTEDGQYGAKADVWSVGCTLVEMVTGKPPWAGQYENMWSAIFHIAQSQGPPPTPGDIPAGAKAVLEKAFLRNASKRPSAEELLREPWLKE